MIDSNILCYSVARPPGHGVLEVQFLDPLLGGIVKRIPGVDAAHFIGVS